MKTYIDREQCKHRHHKRTIPHNVNSNTTIKIIRKLMNSQSYDHNKPTLINSGFMFLTKL